MAFEKVKRDKIEAKAAAWQEAKAAEIVNKLVELNNHDSAMRLDEMKGQANREEEKSKVLDQVLEEAYDHVYGISPLRQWLEKIELEAPSERVMRMVMDLNTAWVSFEEETRERELKDKYSRHFKERKFQMWKIRECMQTV
eukprot:Gb_12945 [translate_table: standard]